MDQTEWARDGLGHRLTGPDKLDHRRTGHLKSSHAELANKLPIPD